MTKVDTGTDRLLAHVEDGIGWVVYNNPERHNAVSYDMSAAVPGVLATFADDPSVRVVVMRGAGDRAFISGADISEFGDRRTEADARAEYDAALYAAWTAWRAIDKPVIAMIHGYCLGGGLLTALKADIRIADDAAQFAIPAARLGLGFSFQNVAEVAALVGPATTAEMVFSAHRVSADDALRIGLVNRVVPPADLDQVVRTLATTISANAPLTIKAAKAALRELRREPPARDLDAVAALVEACYRSDDYREGQAAFAEKRPPQFRGL